MQQDLEYGTGFLVKKYKRVFDFYNANSRRLKRGAIVFGVVMAALVIKLGSANDFAKTCSLFHNPIQELEWHVSKAFRVRSVLKVPSSSSKPYINNTFSEFEFSKLSTIANQKLQILQDIKLIQTTNIFLMQKDIKYFLETYCKMEVFMEITLLGF